MAKEFNIVDFIISQTTPAKFDAGGYVDFDPTEVLTDYSSALNPYGSDPDFYTNNMADAAARAAAAIAGGTSNVGGFGGDTNAWDMVPEAGGKGSVNDQVNKQGIIDAYLAELDLLTNNLTDMDTSVIDANAAEAMAALPPLTPAETQAKANADAAEIAAGDDDRNIIQKIGTKVGEVFDSIFETLGLPNPTQAIASIFDKTGTFVWGPPSGSPVINTGTTPGGTQTGTTTGNAALDAVLNKVLSVVVGRIEAGEAISPATAKEILVATAADETGMTTEEVDALIDASKNTADAVTSLDDAVGTDLDVVLGDANSDTDAKADNVFGDGNAEPVVELEPEPEPEGEDVLGDGEEEVVTDVVTDVVGDGEEVVTDVVTDEPESEPLLPEPKTPEASPSFFGVRTKPGEVGNIEYYFDVFGDSILPPGAKTLEEEKDPLAPLYSGYAEGGIVQDYDIEQLIKYLKGAGD